LEGALNVQKAAEDCRTPKRKRTRTRNKRPNVKGVWTLESALNLQKAAEDCRTPKRKRTRTRNKRPKVLESDV
jgi:hypothetical protein